MTIFVFPVLIMVLIIMEYRLWSKTFAKHLNFLDYPGGKGAYIIMLGLIIIEKPFVVEVIFCLILSLIGLFNIAVGIAIPLGE